MEIQEETSFEKVRKFINIDPVRIAEAVNSFCVYSIKPELEGYCGFLPVHVKIDIKDLSKFARIWDNL
jgi:hypothetical protein